MNIYIPIGIYIAMIEQFTKREFIEGDPAKPEQNNTSKIGSIKTHFLPSCIRRVITQRLYH